MDMREYVNSSAVSGGSHSEERENSQSETVGKLKVCKLVGVSFGLLCIIQSALNVALRLQTTAFSNNSDHISSTDVTPMSTAEILLLENNVTKIEVSKLEADGISNNKQLHDRLSQQRNWIVQLQNENSRLMHRLSKLEQGCPRCPLGWRRYMSSCYEVSTERKGWNNAQEDCKSKGAHLLVINDGVEEDVLYAFGPQYVWIGLRRRQNRWTWVDGSTLFDPARIHQPPGDLRRDCVFAVGNTYMNWASARCQEPHYWVCEKELK